MATTIHRLHLDLSKPLVDAPSIGHNRWHPEIEPAICIEPGDEVELDMRDSMDGQINARSSSADLAGVDMTRAHPLTGPIHVAGAEPGDLLIVDVLEVRPASWGWTALMPGFSFLGDELSETYLVHWELDGGTARSEQLPGVCIPGAPFLGVMGVAPSAAAVGEWAARDRRWAAAGAAVALPESRNAIPRTPNIASEGLRTLPPRENGGNIDVKRLIAGSRLLLPVEVPGALFSSGDTHFAQGNGESCGTAIEVCARATLRFGVRKARELHRRPRFPSIECDGVSLDRTVSGCVGTIGISVDGVTTDGQSDVGRAVKAALREMLEHLTSTYSLSRQQAAVVVSVACDIEIAALVNSPHVVANALLPTAVVGNL
jgi:formamidase